MRFNLIKNMMIAVALTMVVGCSQNITDMGPSSSKSSNTRAVVPSTQAVVTTAISSWGTSFNGTIYIENKGTTPIEQWGMSFDWDYDITSSWGCEIVSHVGSTYTVKYLSWGPDIAPGTKISFGVGGNVVGTAPEPTNFVVTSGPAGGSGTVTGPVLPPGPSGEFETAYKTMEETTTTFKGNLKVGNVNETYKWNGAIFDIRNVTFRTTSTVTEIKKLPYGSCAFTQVGDLVTFELGYPSFFGLGEGGEFQIIGNKNGANPYPTNFKVNYMRGMEIRYPQYADLPTTWSKGKTNLTSGDLIASQASYYNTNPAIPTDKFIVYNPSHPTQIQIGQVLDTEYPVNTENDVRIHMYSKNMALGVALVYEFLKISPNYMVALGTKENFSCGFIPLSSEGARPVIIDGQQYYWNMKFSSDAPNAASNYHDGPYQQEPGNFNDARVHLHDYLGPLAEHGDIVSPNIVDDLNDPQFITAGFSAGLSITMTRELLNAICEYNNVGYNDFMDNAADRDAELKIVTYAYNRGYGMFLSKGIFGSNRAQALATTDLVPQYDMGGFGAHVPTVNAVVSQMNADTSDIYDSQLTWAELEVFFNQLRKFYAKGEPTDAQWGAMLADVNSAFNVLKAHWGGNTVSFRYDFLTLLRVAKKHLPEVNPRPTGDAWYYNVTGANLN